MSIPTLFIKGMLAAPNGNPELQKELNEWVPIEYILNWFKNHQSKTGIENRVLLLLSMTASGKSTALPPEIYKSFIMGAARGPGIICTQPRVVTAIENVNDMLNHYSKFLRRGETVGWSTKYNKLRPKSYGLLSATIGTLSQQLRVLNDEEIIAKYKFILIDEVHERDLQTDMTIYMLKNFLLRNQTNINCPFVVLMSATFDPKSFLNYFNINLINNFIWCRGETAGFDEIWDWNQGRIINDYARGASTVVEKIVTESTSDEPGKSDILIFMPGAAEITQTKMWLNRLNEKLASDGKNVLSILHIDSNVVDSQGPDYKKVMVIPVEKHEVFIKGKKYIPERRVIISTNVAETGLTIASLKYVIDAGFNREMEYNPIHGIRGLITKPAPKSRIKQRRGRAGRKFRGVFYPLYPQYIYEKLPELQLPQILIEDISEIMIDIIGEQLKFKRLNGENDPQFSLEDIDMVDVPSPDAISSGLEKLYTLGFLSPIAPKWDIDIKEIISGDYGKRFSLTKLGALASLFNMISPESIRAILAAYSWGCSILDIVTIIAYLTMDGKSFVSVPESTDGSPPKKVNINWNDVYKNGLPGFITSSGMIYKMRLLISDEFIDGLILFNAIKYIISGSEPKSTINNLQSWCSKNNISYKGALEFIRKRDELIEQMLMAGFELFAWETESILNSDSSSFMNIITKLKYCIYDGYRNNMLIRDGTVYKTLSGLVVNTPKLFKEDEINLAEREEYGFILEVLPSAVVYHGLELKYNRKTFLFEIIADKISSLDSFVSWDPELAN